MEDLRDTQTGSEYLRHELEEFSAAVVRARRPMPAVGLTPGVTESGSNDEVVSGSLSLGRPTPSGATCRRARSCRGS